jgi:pimeloyl-ACP methyl ester carboxylesterase
MKWLIGLLIVLAIASVVLFETDFPTDKIDAKYRNEASQFLSLGDGSRVHFRDQGNRSGEAIILIHGSNASLHTWEPWVALLGDRYRVVSVDLPGHGLTGRTPADDYSTDAYVSVVQALAGHLNIRQFVLGGNSMGGGVTWRYALAHPEDVLAMILVDASGLPQWRETNPDTNNASTDSTNDEREAPLAFSLLREPWFQGIARYIDPYYLVAQGLKASHFDPDFVDDNLIARYYDLSMRAGTRDATLIRFSSWRGGPQPSWDLGSLTHPTLILWGEDDAVIPAATGQRFADVLPNAQLIVYPDVGHIPMEEVAERSAADVRQFLHSNGL